MAFDKTLHPDCDTEGPFGVPMKDAVAKAVDDLLKAHPGHGDALVKLAGSADVEVGEERTEVSTITTESVDRDREVVVAKGIDLRPYKSNPVVLLNHSWHSLPVGKALWVKSDGAALKARTQYAKRPADHVGEWAPDAVYGLVRQGMLPGKSIGFIPLESKAPEPKDVRARPELADARRIITKSVLLEYSVVAIPSNADALVEAVSKSCPGLAALLGLPEAETKAAEEVTIERVWKELQAAQETIKSLQGVLAWAERLKAVEDDGEALKIAVRGIRKELLAGGGPARASAPSPEAKMLADVAAELRRQFAAA